MTPRQLIPLPMYGPASMTELASGYFPAGKVSASIEKIIGSVAAWATPKPNLMMARTTRELMLPVAMEVRLHTMQQSANIRLRFILSAALPKYRPAAPLAREKAGPERSP